MSGIAREIERAGARQVERGWVRALARGGHFAKAAVYAVIGTLALLLALGEGGRTTGSRGAIATLGEAPHGKALVVLLAVGLAGMALWMLVDAVGDPERTRGPGWFSAAARVGGAIGGLGYLGLAGIALRLAFGDGSVARSDDVAARSWTALALELPGGRWLVLAGGAVAIVAGGRQIWRGLRRDFLAPLDLGAMRAGVRRWAVRLGVAGLCTQGGVLALVGGFFAIAALREDASRAAGLDGALSAVAREPHGMALLGVVALGLLAFAAFSVLEATHKRLGPP